jgi:hypothetical protein
MRTYTGFMLIIFMLISPRISGQTDISIRKKDFKTEKPGLNEAWKHVEIGDKYFSQKDPSYGNAYDEYLLALVYNHLNPELNYKAGVAGLFSDNKQDAAGFLLKAFEVNNKITGDILLLSGRALQYSGMFSEAVIKLEEYLGSPDKKSPLNITQAEKWLEECRSALLITKDTISVLIENQGAEINSAADDYSQILTGNGEKMIFASTRVSGKSGGDENIYISDLVSGKWESAKIIGKNINSKYSETPVHINNTNDKLYLYAGYLNGGDIMVSELNKKGEWRLPVEVPYRINSPGSETSFVISPSGNEIYFVTDRSKDGIGGKDIFYIKKLNEKKWSKPLNAGKNINTVYDEESVRFSKSGDTLWFSSKGHNSIGGYDIFYSIRNNEGVWDTARNYGYPVNTPWDELFYHPSPLDGSSFYFVSNRSGGYGGFDIYSGRVLPAGESLLPGFISDSHTEQDTLSKHEPAPLQQTELPEITEDPGILPDPVREPDILQN